MGDIKPYNGNSLATAGVGIGCNHGTAVLQAGLIRIPLRVAATI
jgi:hypothetical protein